MAHNPPMPDLSHLSAEERQQIMKVMQKAMTESSTKNVTAEKSPKKMKTPNGAVSPHLKSPRDEKLPSNKLHASHNLKIFNQNPGSQNQQNLQNGQKRPNPSENLNLGQPNLAVSHPTSRRNSDKDEEKYTASATKNTQPIQPNVSNYTHETRQNYNQPTSNYPHRNSTSKITSTPLVSNLTPNNPNSHSNTNLPRTNSHNITSTHSKNAFSSMNSSNQNSTSSLSVLNLVGKAKDTVVNTAAATVNATGTLGSVAAEFTLNSAEYISAGATGVLSKSGSHISGSSSIYGGVNGVIYGKNIATSSTNNTDNLNANINENDPNVSRRLCFICKEVTLISNSGNLCKFCQKRYCSRCTFRVPVINLSRLSASQKSTDGSDVAINQPKEKFIICKLCTKLRNTTANNSSTPDLRIHQNKPHTSLEAAFKDMNNNKVTSDTSDLKYQAQTQPTTPKHQYLPSEDPNKSFNFKQRRSSSPSDRHLELSIFNKSVNSNGSKTDSNTPINDYKSVSDNNSSQIHNSRDQFKLGNLQKNENFKSKSSGLSPMLIFTASTPMSSIDSEHQRGKS